MLLEASMITRYIVDQESTIAIEARMKEESKKITNYDKTYIVHNSLNIQVEFETTPLGIPIRKLYLIVFYHLKKILYQLYHTILQYSSIPTFILQYNTLK